MGAQNQRALQYAPVEVRSDIVKKLVATTGNKKHIAVMSVRFSWGQNASMISARMHEALATSVRCYYWYSPNTFTKSFCGPAGGFVDKAFKCNGTAHGACNMKCKKNNGQECDECVASLKRTTDHSCWRFSFLDHMSQASQDGKGFMLQILEPDEEGRFKPGKGQEIESEMADDLGLTVFRVEVASENKTTFQAAVNRLKTEIRKWEVDGCRQGVQTHIKYEDYVRERNIIRNAYVSFGGIAATSFLLGAFAFIAWQVDWVIAWLTRRISQHVLHVEL